MSIKESVQMRIRQALDTVTYNETLKAHVISARYWEDLEPDTFNLYSSKYELTQALIKELVRRWG